MVAGLQRLDGPTASPLAGPQPKPASCADSNLSRPVTHQSESPRDTEARTGERRGRGGKLLSVREGDLGTLSRWQQGGATSGMRGERGEEEEEDRQCEESEVES